METARSPNSSSHSSFSASSEPLLKNDDPRTAVKQPRISRTVAVFIIGSLSGITFSSSMSHGLLAVGLPYIATDLKLPDHLLLWPSSVAALASGCCLLIAGALADLVGDRLINITGTILLTISALGSAIATSGLSLIMFRLVEGLSVSMCLPTGVSIITRSFPPGKRRNIGFACLGLSQPLGFSLGMVLEGLFATAPDLERPNFHWRSVLYEIDWIGALIASTCLGIICYICAVLTENISNIYAIPQIILIVISLTLMPVFVFWMDFQERRGKPVLIPNSMWKNNTFVSISLVVLLTWGVLQGSELFLSLFFQKIQHLSPLETSARLLPNILLGILLNVTTGLIVHAVRIDYLILLTAVAAAISPLLMAIIDPKWNYWACAFWAVLLGPVGVDVVFTVAHLIITDIFPESTHALAGAVFNTIAQLGTSIGLCAIAVISSAAKRSSGYPEDSPNALMTGYRAAFWTCFAMTASTIVVACIGLRNIRRLGAPISEPTS
ncbi:hypothetical protein LOZ53_001771 [Ophidiomyces ophidiicola]|nr:hypothetical protein LOZ55_004303 [Ophidiomyces ophidiicola]KAI1982568.1 hypothetical protein LOZ54_005373 [Ophidiomyces ophidiicola]KAI1994644.1 hypothetical protein LOZ53_001771 [Ophidiomyces ophidiicola]